MSNNSLQQAKDLWEKSPSIENCLPISFEGNDDQVWTDVGGGCARCGQDLPIQDVRGNLSCLIPSVKTLNMVAYCRHCNVLFWNTLRFRSDGAVEWQQGGKWVKSYGKKITFWTRFLEAIHSFWRRICLK